MPRPPHILIISTDQHRADSLGCYGHPVVQTPHLDRIAHRGCRFTNAYTVAPVCMPARASFLTGLYPHNHGIVGNKGFVPPDATTYFQHLSRQGYLTAHIGKSHYYDYTPLTQFGCMHMREMEPLLHKLGLEYVHETAGYWGSGAWTGVPAADSYVTDHWRDRGCLDAYRSDYERRLHEPFYKVFPSAVSEDDYLDSYIGRKAVEFIAAYEGDRPLCLHVSFPGPHLPFDAPGRYATRYDPDTCPPPIPASAMEEPWLPEHARRILREEEDFNRNPFCRPEPTPRDIRLMRANYYGEITLIDDWIGRITAACSRRGWDDRLLTLFWSDHGDMMGDHRRIEKFCFYEGSAKVPLLASLPGVIPAGTESGALVEIIDLLPTAIDAAGITPAAFGHGRSFLDAAAGRTPGHRETVLSELPSRGRCMIRNERFKYYMMNDTRGLFLHDLQDDPEERRNLLGHPDCVEIEQDLRRQLLARLAATPSDHSQRPWPGC